MRDYLWSIWQVTKMGAHTVKSYVALVTMNYDQVDARPDKVVAITNDMIDRLGPKFKYRLIVEFTKRGVLYDLVELGVKLF